MKNALSLALAAGNKNITPQHILYGLSQQKGSIAAQILHQAKVESTEIKKMIKNEPKASETITQIGLSQATKKIIEKSFILANLNHHYYIGTEHILASLLSLEDLNITLFLEAKGINIKDIKKQVELILNSTSKFPDITNSMASFNNSENNDELFGASETTTRQSSALEVFGTNLTDPNIQREIDPVIGREIEIERLIQILSRRNKNNPLLLGDPGVGKTAIVEGLAKKITQGDVPEVLVGKKIYTLDLSLVVAGTSFRGEFENRLKQIITEVKRNPNIILFIDEIHNIIGIGSATGSMDAANILKPALARGEIRCIGATTTEEYKKYIESDPALDRRFQPIFVSQPSVEKTIAILEGIKENYELFHQVKITKSAITAAAQLSDRYISDRFLPDKAIDLIDEASAAAKIKRSVNPLTREISQLENQLRHIEQKKRDNVSKEKFSAAIKLRQQEQEIMAKLREARQQLIKKQETVLDQITEQDIAAVVSKITSVPLSDLIVEEKNSLLNLEKILGEKIVGQAEALKSVAEFIRRSRTGINDANRPIGSFIFLGPSGVGKTELARTIAKTVFGNPQSLIKIDMSEYAESFNISKLIGAPAGYVGYKEGTKLTDAVKHRPYSVVLFDEIEKAHRQIFNLLLQILEDGQLTDATGKKINFKNTIIIMTSNLGSESFNRQAAIGFQNSDKNAAGDDLPKMETIKNSVLDKLKEKFPPEFLSRLDKVVVFKPLKINDIEKITTLQLNELQERLAKQGINLKISDEVVNFIAKNSFSPDVGARAIRQTIQNLIESQMANKILQATNKKKHQLTVKVKNNQIII
ncbi:MAG: ATP-dependent Clp protease ATP-binding subunit [Patescibacteria group bacterium]|nr:ATP-dependent Clp protease ATP-binding subunit [Patescibacteria group bacterium]